MTCEISNVIMPVVAIVVAYGCYVMIANDRGTTKLSDHSTFWKARMRVKGLELTSQAAYDAAPCDVKWILTGPTVLVKKPGRIRLRLVKAIDKGTVTIQQLEAMSKWPVTRLP